MKKRVFLVVLAMFITSAIVFPKNFVSAVESQETLQNEEISSYAVHVFINKNGSLHVKENISYDFGAGSLEGASQKHGIYRDIPFEYGNGLLKKQIDINNISVTNNVGNSYHFKISENNGNKRIKIGDEDVFVEGKKEYHIEYDVIGAVILNDTVDLVNWNMIGANWQVPIKNVLIETEVSPEIFSKIKKVECFEGAVSSDIPCVSSGVNKQKNVFVFTTKELLPHEGMTVGIYFEPQTFPRPTAMDKFWNVVRDFWPMCIPVAVFFFLFIKWWKTGRDPKGKGTLIVQFDAPDNLTPLEVGTLIDEIPDAKDISAQIIALAQQGYIRIVQEEKVGWFGGNTFTLLKLKTEEGLNNEFDKILLKGLFQGKIDKIDEVGVLARTSLDELKYKFSPYLADIKTTVLASLTDKGYFNKNPHTIRNTYIFVGMGIFFSLYFIFDFFGGSLVFFAALAVSAILCICFAPLMASRTQKGVYAREHILGLKQYLSVAEKDRIQFHNAPEKNPQVFEKFLPYAMVLGVEKEWAGQFADMYKEMQPSWYSSTGNMHLSSLYLVQGLRNFSTSSATMVAAVRSSSTGGGGFSGGGFGGGGGGSW